MKISRRNLFGFGGALVAAAAVPEIATAKPSDEAVGPAMFEHTCDGGRSRYTAEQAKEQEAIWENFGGIQYWGCGTTFRWYLGCTAYCPNCGYAYSLSLNDIKTGFYKRIQ